MPYLVGLAGMYCLDVNHFVLENTPAGNYLLADLEHPLFYLSFSQVEVGHLYSHEYQLKSVALKCPTKERYFSNPAGIPV